jgi:hypothetical protein
MRRHLKFTKSSKLVHSNFIGFGYIYSKYMQQRAKKARLPSINKKTLTMEVIHEQEKFIYLIDRGSHWNS